MADFHSKLVRKEEIAEGTMAFYLEKPADITYQAGQHPSFLILNPTETDEEGNKRTFSFITIPSDPEIGFATRMRDSAFKRILKNAEPGLEIDILNPRGSMVLPEDTTRPLVFLAGGIGITPLYSMIKQATRDLTAHKIHLFYANRTIAQTAFLDDLNGFSAKNPNFTFIPSMTQEDNSWTGEKGRITKELIQKYVPDTNNTIFYMAGPTGMVSGMMEILTSLNVDPIFIKNEDYGEYK